MLRRISLPALFVIAAIVTMILAAGGLWQFAKPMDEMLQALAPTWVGIAAVFWVLWRRIPPARDTNTAAHPSPHQSGAGFEPLQLERRYADISRLPLAALDYVVIDTETTGPNTANDAIVQIGAVRITGGRVSEIDSFSRLVNPGCLIPAASTRFHGVTDAMVADAQKIKIVLAEFLDYAGDAVLIGHNVTVDLSMMNQVERVGNPTLDTMLLSIGVFETRRNHTLDALAKHFNEPVHCRHTALKDADLTARIFLRLLPELDRIGASRYGDAQDLCAHSAKQVDNLVLQS